MFGTDEGRTEEIDCDDGQSREGGEEGKVEGDGTPARPMDGTDEMSEGRREGREKHIRVL